MEKGSIPIGFSMALAQDLRALNAFAAMDDAAKGRVLERSRNASSKEDMQSLIRKLAQGIE